MLFEGFAREDEDDGADMQINERAELSHRCHSPDIVLRHVFRHTLHVRTVRGAYHRRLESPQ